MKTAAELNRARNRNRLEDTRLIMHVKVTFIADVLGTASADPDIHGTYVASKIKKKQRIAEKLIRHQLTDEEKDERVRQELEDVMNADPNQEVAKGKTVFPRNDKGEPILFDYQVKGFFKSACGYLRTVPESESHNYKSYRSRIDQGIFVYSDAGKAHMAFDSGVMEDKEVREIVIHSDKPVGDCQRPLRASTPQGDRVAISDSDSIAAGAWMIFDIVSLGGEKDREMIEEWLDYGAFNGIGGWRNARHGSFIWEYVD